MLRGVGCAPSPGAIGSCSSRLVPVARSVSIMKRLRLLAAVLLVGLAATGLSCLPDRATAPELPPPNASLLGGLLQATGLLQCSPLPYASTTKVIGPAGG